MQRQTKKIKCSIHMPLSWSLHFCIYPWISVCTTLRSSTVIQHLTGHTSLFSFLICNLPLWQWKFCPTVWMFNSVSCGFRTNNPHTHEKQLLSLQCLSTCESSTPKCGFFTHFWSDSGLNLVYPHPTKRFSLYIQVDALFMSWIQVPKPAIFLFPSSKTFNTPRITW